MEDSFRMRLEALARARAASASTAPAPAAVASAGGEPDQSREGPATAAPAAAGGLAALRAMLSGGSAAGPAPATPQPTEAVEREELSFNAMMAAHSAKKQKASAAEQQAPPEAPPEATCRP